MKVFNADKFFAGFEISLRAIREAERVTKDALRSLSRELLEQIHYESKIQGDIQPLNRLLEVLTPMNKKALVLFMQEFSGFKYDEDKGVFGKKNKAIYEQCLAASIESLEDPHFNLWTWAERNIKMEAKPFQLDKVTKFMQQSIKKAAEEGIGKADLIKAVMAGGISVDEIVAVLESMGEVEVKAE